MMTNDALHDMWMKAIAEADRDLADTQKTLCKPFAQCRFGMTYIGISGSGEKYLFLEMDKTSADHFTAPSVRGLSFAVLPVAALGRDKLYLRIGLAAGSGMEEAFQAFAIKLIHEVRHVFDCRDVIETMRNVLDRFTYFFGEGKRNFLPPMEEQGLFGELLFLKQAVVAKGAAAVDAWVGAEKNKHDFIFADNVGVEVKTLCSQVRKNISISNENQLNCSERSKLFLKVYTLESNPQGRTFTDLIGDIEHLLAGSEQNRTFRRKLLEDGVMPGITQPRTKFTAVAEATYLVSDDFPRIAKSELNSRIFNVRYKLNIDGLEPCGGDIFGKA